MIISYHKDTGLVALVGAEDKNLMVADVENDPRLFQDYTIHYQNGALIFEDSYQTKEKKKRDDALNKATTIKSLKDLMK